MIPDFAHRMDQTPVCRNIYVSGRRTSVRMEPVMWQSLDEIRDQENMTLNQLCGLIDSVRSEAGLTAALRIFIISYYRAQAQEEIATPRIADALRRFDPNAERRSPSLSQALQVFG